MPSDGAPLDFTRRAAIDQCAEWMDAPCDYETFRGCLRDIAKANTVTLAARPTLGWLRQFAGARADRRPLHVVDVGCGGGDTLRRVARWAKATGTPVRLTGVDLNPHAARAAREFSGATAQIEWVTGDAFSYRPEAEIDVVISSLFTHHLPDEEIVRFLGWMEAVARRGWFVNDLLRNRWSYIAFGALATAARWHPFVRHDGPVSIRRAFRWDDWERYLAAAGIAASAARVEEFFPGRLCVARVKR